MTFQIGDRVRVVNQSQAIEDNGYGPHNGRLGTVKSVPDEGTKFYGVSRDDDQLPLIHYQEDNLEFVPSGSLLNAEFSLDEMEVAEAIIGGLR